MPHPIQKPTNQVTDRNVENLSGGELQRFAIAVVALQEAGVYMIDEPSSYLDVRQRLKAAEVIRGLLASDKYVIVVEHDLSVLDYLSDFICCLYGKPGAYGVVTLPFSVREGINIFLGGFVPTENLRFREESLSFKVSDTTVDGDEGAKRFLSYKYPAMTKTQGNFKLHVGPAWRAVWCGGVGGGVGQGHTSGEGDGEDNKGRGASMCCHAFDRGFPPRCSCA